MKLFTKSARAAAFGNAALLLRAYVSLANGLWPSLIPTDSWLELVFPRPGEHEFANLFATTFYGWLQAQLAIQSLHQIHKKLVRIAEGDN